MLIFSLLLSLIHMKIADFHTIQISCAKSEDMLKQANTARAPSYIICIFAK